MWYTGGLINQWSLIGGWCFTFNQLWVLWLQLILSCQNCPIILVESKKSHGDHKALEHGLANRRAVLPISSNILKYRISKKMKKPKNSWKSMAQFLSLRVLSLPASKKIVQQLSWFHTNGKNQIFPISSNMSCSYINDMWLGHVYDKLPGLQIPGGLTIPCPRSKTSATFSNMASQTPLFFGDHLVSGRKGLGTKISKSSKHM